MDNICHSSGTASDSICPKGWRLPESYGDETYSNLIHIYHAKTGNKLSHGDTIIQIAPLNFLRAGIYDYTSNSLTFRTTYGYYWSGRYYSIPNSYRLPFEATGLHLQNSNSRGYGFSLRCLARLKVGLQNMKRYCKISLCPSGEIGIHVCLRSICASVLVRVQSRAPYRKYLPSTASRGA